MSGFGNVSDIEPDNRSGYFQGIVVDNLDPEMRQRIKVRIPNLMDGDPELLPWIGPVVHSKFGMTAEAVTVEVPVVDAIVQVEFQNGDPHYGMTFGSLHTAISAELGVLATNYPMRRGWVDPAGNWSYIDLTEGAIEFQLHHYSGTQYTTFNDGRVLHEAVGDYTITAPIIHLNP